MSILFANTRSQSGGQGNLLEFKAGRTLLEPGSAPGKRKGVADKARGLIFIKQSNDQLMHFCWRNRDNNTTPTDLIIFPGDTEFFRIKECTDGRVYMLRFKSTNDHHLFWMQEPSSDKDDEYCKKINELLNNPPARARAGGSERANAANSNPVANNTLNALNSAISGGEDMSAFGNMDQNQLMQLFSLMNGSNSDVFPIQGLPGAQNDVESRSTTTPKTRKETAASGSQSTGGTDANKFDAQLLNQIISALPNAPTNKRRQVELSKVLTRANVDSVAQAHAEQLAPHLPTTSAQQEISVTIGNPQFQQATDFFSYALQSGQLGTALRHFKLADNVVEAAESGDVLQFAQQLTSSMNGDKGAHASSSEAKPDSTPQKPTDDNMDLD